MSVELQPVDIEVFGRLIRVNCPEEQKKDLHEAAEELNQRFQDFKMRTKAIGAEQLVFVIALNLCYELNQEKTKACSFASSMDERMRLLQRTIDDALCDQVSVSKITASPFE
ncbi:Z-ring-associated protein [Candidatus Williamhamiltonella defendens]|uniref:Cell division protein ZapA n=1 Tax=Candidatus Williamhamiltonella defendens TaxID=138072 RepID=A0A2D3T3N4_9ENTR|nr:cell division protein ZapA [Candidatus Hamiltonella defensa]ATW30400.1 Z-ring-associated protein [Candidatus Hamiltonella defensa]ATW32413.1 Z-ring-associated protein [Candidatus Hamiltonella defensa]